ncbi:gamma-glutamyltransferase [Proteus faecis]|uniref:Glutathione hydrolase proenzyme n=1 Tax=Proteus faecis TaxID=2050967 RepID=A0AAW7CYZ8_9GAMM|nr:gamma-glutamyltransferase [Proteus faecis]MDL5168349.1 gamma-glutamyltransferase [Proteus faecis]MDL5276334.1 gamma-glutamyltransferase [Proteus faecis]MDL5279901.1 gamma-glutamyltransferase [Proteus faecis]MDL5308904.1 gamma-glutamyltransferase [Proteus faecis]MDL5312544.1 gamma-glutamyltransferase [Proteus faecis]
MITIKRTHLLLLTTLFSTSLYAAYEPAVEAQHGMVVSSQHLASQVGNDILQKGGNAIDAAVAVGYAQAVVNACCGNIGGGGFMTIHLADGTNTFINFRETAPASASKDMYLDKEGNLVKDASLYGYLASGVPGTVKGLDIALEKYGTLSRQDVMAPAIKLAREGYILTRADTDVLETTTERFKQDPESAKIFLKPDGTPWQPGDRLIQTDLANTLELIANQGADAFYQGEIPKKVEEASKQHNGLLTQEDFANFTITETKPITCTYRGYEFISAPPPSSGGVTICQTLNILEGYDLKSMGFNSAEYVHTLTEAMRHAYMDRNTFLGDPQFIKNPTEKLLSKTYATEIRQQIMPNKATPSEKVQPGIAPHESPETTHYSVIDKNGNAVSTTYTINGRFGAVVIAPGTGFFLNNEMDDFTTKVGEKNLYGLVQGERNSIAPLKRPLSSMSPTIVTKEGKPFLILGSPGGSRIISITLQTALNIIEFGMPPQEAVNSPRIHHQWLPDEVYYEQRGLSKDTLEKLASMGYKMVEQTPWGAAELIMVGLPGEDGVIPASSGNDSAVSGAVREGYLYGSNDVRRPAGKAVGY